MSGVLSFHTVTSKVRKTCVAALTYCISACSIEKLGVAGGRGPVSAFETDSTISTCKFHFAYSAPFCL